MTPGADRHGRLEELRWLWVALLAAVTVVVLAWGSYHLFTRSPWIQAGQTRNYLFAAQPAPPLGGRAAATQEFRSPRAGLARIDVFVAQRRAGSLQLQLSDIATGEIVRVAKIPPSAIQTEAFAVFTFPAIEQSRGRRYEAVFSAPGAAAGTGSALGGVSCDCLVPGSFAFRASPEVPGGEGAEGAATPMPQDLTIGFYTAAGAAGTRSSHWAIASERLDALAPSWLGARVLLGVAAAGLLLTALLFALLLHSASRGLGGAALLTLYGAVLLADAAVLVLLR